MSPVGRKLAGEIAKKLSEMAVLCGRLDDADWEEMCDRLNGPPLDPRAVPVLVSLCLGEEITPAGGR